MSKLRMLALALAALGALATPAARADAHLTLVHGLSGEPLGYDRARSLFAACHPSGFRPPCGG